MPINLINISKYYASSKIQAINSINLTIPDGVLLGLVGHNGAGKTTLFQILTGILKPSQGNLFINGKSFENNKYYLRNIIGYLPQEYALYPTLTCYQNLKYFGNFYSLSFKELEERIDFFLEKFELISYKNRLIKYCSGGIKRRINLIVALLSKPKILLLDEPTVGVDIQSKLIILDQIKKLNSQGMTIIISSHNLDDIQFLCTSLILLQEGKINFFDELSQLNGLDSENKNLYNLLFNPKV